VGITVNWVKYLKLSEREDVACSICLFRGYLAVVGYANFSDVLKNVTQPSIILFDRSRGHIVRKWVGEDNGYFLNCFSIGNMLYTVGWCAIYAFDEDLNLLNKAKGSSGSLFCSITYDGEYLYVGGVIYEDINEGIWYIEKRTKSLELVSYKELYTEDWKYGAIQDLGINPATGELWAVGFYNDTSNEDHSFTVIFDKELRELKRIDYPKEREYYLSSLFGICFDNIGNAYVGGLDGVAKFDKYGNILKVNKDVGARKVTFINGLVYTFDIRYLSLGFNYSRHVLYILDSELNIIEKHVLSENVNADSYFFPGRPCFDGKNIYVAGCDEALGKDRGRWVTYSILVPTEKVTKIY